ncbi:MAG: hypothetical protein KA715_07130 [Xanthomonadaceae bacterium]|nr:hypothetical protein [Xanthomonadaceae bacterium]
MRKKPLILMFALGFTPLSNPLVFSNRVEDISKYYFGSTQGLTSIFTALNKINSPKFSQAPALPSIKTSQAAQTKKSKRNYDPDWSDDRSEEWKDLPHQRWEPPTFELPPDVDPLGFDKNSRITYSRNRGFELTHLVTSEELIPLGEITGSRSDGTGLSMSDILFIQPKDHLQIGETYSITDEPTILKSAKSRHYGYSYPNLGRVKITGVRDGVFMGKVTHAAGIIKRGQILVPLIQRVREVTMIPAPQSIESVLLVDSSTSTFAVAQYKTAAVDKGASDGVRVGMVFRAYQYFDPLTDRRLTESDMLPDADFLVIQVSENLSSVLALNSQTIIPEGSSLMLMTDVTDVMNAKEIIEQVDSTQELNTEKTLDDLDTLDHGEDVGRGEKKEIKQLEEWKPSTDEVKPTVSKPVAPVPPGAELPAEAPTDVPPPPPEGATSLDANPPTGEAPPPAEAPPVPDTQPPPEQTPPSPAPVEAVQPSPVAPETAPISPMSEPIKEAPATQGPGDLLYTEPPPLPPPPTSD